AMSSEPQSVERSTPLTQAARLMKEHDVGSLPVVDGGQLMGIVTDRDIVVRAIASSDGNLSSMTVGDIASRDPQTVDPEQDLGEALRVMAKNQVRRVPVVEDGRLVGMLAQADVAEKGDAQETGELVEEISRA